MVNVVAHQKLIKEAEITEQNSLLLLTRNLLRIAIFNIINYIRGLFPENYFNDKKVPAALETKIKKLMPVDHLESRSRLIEWIEKGVYDALQKKYLKKILRFCICETIDGPMIEEYAFAFSYSNAESQDVLMNVTRSGNKKQGETFKCNSTTEITPMQMKSSACKMIRTLVQLMRTLDKMPDERTILMKLLYYDDVTPSDYEPPFFRGCTDEETRNQWSKNLLKMEVGNVNSKHFTLALKVKSVLDPCDGDNEENRAESVSLGADSVRDDSSESGSEVSSSQEDAFILAPVDNPQRHQEDTMVSQASDDTQDPAEDEHQLSRVKEWIISSHLDAVEVTYVLANFPDISVVLIEEIMEKLVLEGFLSKTGKDTFAVVKQKEMEYELNVKEQTDDQVPVNDAKAAPGSGEDYMYMKALYHALPMDYISIVKLQRKLEGNANQTTVRKLIDQMTKDGFVEATSNRKLGKRVIHSEVADKKLSEVRKALDMDEMDVEVTPSQNKMNHSASENHGNKTDLSTCGVLLSESEINQNGSLRTDQSISTAKEGSNTPTSKSKGRPVASRESMISGVWLLLAMLLPTVQASSCQSSEGLTLSIAATVAIITVLFLILKRLHREDLPHYITARVLCQTHEGREIVGERRIRKDSIKSWRELQERTLTSCDPLMLINHPHMFRWRPVFSDISSFNRILWELREIESGNIFTELLAHLDAVEVFAAEPVMG